MQPRESIAQIRPQQNDSAVLTPLSGDECLFLKYLVTWTMEPVNVHLHAVLVQIKTAGMLLRAHLRTDGTPHVSFSFAWNSSAIELVSTNRDIA